MKLKRYISELYETDHIFIWYRDTNEVIVAEVLYLHGKTCSTDYGDFYLKKDCHTIIEGMHNIYKNGKIILFCNIYQLLRFIYRNKIRFPMFYVEQIGFNEITRHSIRLAPSILLKIIKKNPKFLRETYTLPKGGVF